MADAYSVLSYPELLPEEKLIEILSSRGIPEKELCEKDKDVLVQLSHRYVVPLPQRTTNMRRANRLRKQLHPIRAIESNSSETQNKNTVLKRKQLVHGMDESNKFSNFVCENELNSPTTVCAKQIDKLTVGTTLSKPVKLNRKFLATEQKAKIISHLPKPPKQYIDTVKFNKNTPGTEVAKETHQDILASSDPEIDNEDEMHRKSKKFKKTPVTWP